MFDLFVLRQELDGIYFEREQVADCVRVLLAIQSVRHDRLVAVGRGGGFVERVLEPGDERLELRLVRPRLLRRGHCMAAQLAHRHLELLGVRGNVIGADALQIELARELGAVVALRAIAIDERPLLRRALGDGRLADETAAREHGRDGSNADGS